MVGEYVAALNAAGEGEARASEGEANARESERAR